MPDNSKPSTAPIQPRSDSQDKQKASVLERTVEKINAADSILVALSDNPDVDQMTAAIALTMALDGIGKHATAIFSGQIPNAIEFLKPEETFERNTNSLQDFIIALNKEKADHIRYMIEGDFVKIYITPYRTTIDQKDLEFSHGDYNVDLVIAFDVKNSEDLDDALSEYGRIMHDATAINISNKASGRFAEIEWVNEKASSVCEMVVALIDQLGAAELGSNIATALLTGIVAATDHFSNSQVTPETMSLAARLMSAGADQQLISANITKQGTVTVEEDSSPEPETPKEPEALKEDSKDTQKEKGPASSQARSGSEKGEIPADVLKKLDEAILAEDNHQDENSSIDLPKTPTNDVTPTDDATLADEVSPARKTAPTPVENAPSDMVESETKNAPIQPKPEEELIPTPASVNLPQPEPTNIPDIITNPAAAAAPAIGFGQELPNLPQVDYTSMYSEPTSVSPVTQPAPQSMLQPASQPVQAPQPMPTQPTPQYQPISPETTNPPQPTSPAPAEPTSASDAMAQLEQLVQPVAQPDYNSMMAAELNAAAATTPPVAPAPTPVVTIQEPALAPAPPLPMPDFNTLPPAPAPIIPDIIPPLAPIPVTPQPVAPTPAPTQPSNIAPSAPLEPLAPAMPNPATQNPATPNSPATPTPISPTPSAPAPQDNAAFQIPNYPLS